MTKIYLILLMVFTFSLSGQEPTKKSTNNNEIAGFKLYPNPTFNDVVYITTKKNLSKTVQVYDLLGELVLQAHSHYKELNISKLDAGVYIVQVTENNKTSSRKLVVK
ncbi:T9SS type A sorting domain-containing protein [Cellulophaga baltica]|uniref:T9SS type A sorting domain-containing protein n=1 Tax=Cellulophaga baltica TaxID=76594 RepID=UPI0015F4F1C3|nr:T9SS type A sorting domain-containing protein [Cellulophaga baltica]MBA6315334.1 T9SS type A sorting domain-containing protein [Cellulophaga baltica]